MGSVLAFRIVFAAIFVLHLLIRSYYAALVMRSRVRSGETRPPWERWRNAIESEGLPGSISRILVSLAWYAAMFAYIGYPGWMAQFSFPLPTWLRWAGAGLGALSLPLLIWVHQTLGNYFSPDLELRRQHRLVRSGPYRWVRHPMYTVLFALMLGLALVSADWLVALLTIALIVLIYARIGREEAMMLEHFGEEYRAYMEQTGRLLPRFPQPGER